MNDAPLSLKLILPLHRDICVSCRSLFFMWNELLSAVILKDIMFLPSPFPHEELPACSYMQTLSKSCGISHVNRNYSGTGWINSTLPRCSVCVSAAGPVAKPVAQTVGIWQVLFWFSSRKKVFLEKKKKFCFPCHNALELEIVYSTSSCCNLEKCSCVLCGIPYSIKESKFRHCNVSITFIDAAMPKVSVMWVARF